MFSKRIRLLVLNFTCLFIGTSLYADDSSIDKLSKIYDPVIFEAEIKKYSLSDVDYYNLLLAVCNKRSSENIHKIVVNHIALYAEYRDYDYQTLIHQFMMKDQSYCGVYLIDLLNDLNAMTPFGGTLLHEAVSMNNNVIAEELIGRGADVDLFDGRNKKPISHAVSRRNLKLFKQLLIKTNLADKTPWNECLYNSLYTFIAMSKISNGSEYLKLLEEEYSNRKVKCSCDENHQ